MEIKITLPMLGRMFMLPASVVDNYLKITDGDYLKALLCIYCQGQPVVDTAEISQLSGVPEERVREALIHFSKLGVLQAEGLTGAQNTQITPQAPTPAQPVSPPAPQPKADDLKLIGGAEAIKGTNRRLEKLSRVRYSNTDIDEMISRDETLRDLKDRIEGITGRGLNHAAIGDIIEMYDHMQLPAAGIILLAEFCVGTYGKRSTAYMLTVAQDWFEEGITDYDQIERKIIDLTELSSYESRLKGIFEFQGSTTKKQREFFERWKTWGFDVETVRAAYEENMNLKNKFTLPYINKILEGWHMKGITNAEQAKAELQNKPKNDSKGGISTQEYDEFARNIDFDKLTT